MTIDTHNLNYDPAALVSLPDAELIQGVARPLGLSAVVYVDDSGVTRYGVTPDEPRRILVGQWYLSAPSVGDRVITAGEMTALATLIE